MILRVYLIRRFFLLQIFQRLSHTGPILRRKTDGITTLTYHPTLLMRGCEKSPGERAFKW